MFLHELRRVIDKLRMIINPLCYMEVQELGLTCFRTCYVEWYWHHTSALFGVPGSWSYQLNSPTYISAMFHTLGPIGFLRPSPLLGLVSHWCFFVFFFSEPISLELLILFPYQPVSLFTLQRKAHFFFWVASCYLVPSLCEIWKHSSNLCHLIKKCVDFQWK